VREERVEVEGERMQIEIEREKKRMKVSDKISVVSNDSYGKYGD
jgi:hypothetical protein